jgi:hypothetical protein
MAKLAGLAGIVAELRTERTNLLNKLQHVDAALSVLGKLDGGSSYTAPNRRMSAAARKKIGLAQKVRWAKNASKRDSTVQPKRVISASARRKMAAAQKKRWAAFRAAKKSK